MSKHKTNSPAEQDPLLSIVIPAYNVEEFIRPAVDSALAQDFDSFEVIVVNDGSTDHTVERLQDIDNPRLRIVHQSNSGLSAARNTGILNARGKYIGLLDGDDLWHPQKAARHVECMEQNPSLGITFSYSVYIDDDGHPSGQLLISKVQRPTLREMIMRNHVGNGSTAVVKRECFDQAGLFDISLFSCEDYEMWVRILQKTQFQCGLVPELLTEYRVRSGSLTLNYDKFLDNARKVMEIFDTYLENFPPSLRNRALAEIYRITSRKALSAGQLDLAYKFMKEALKHSPSLIIRDLRAFGTLVLIQIQRLLPEGLREVSYNMARALMNQFYRVFSWSLNRERKSENVKKKFAS
jgi:glycosyltransferase involved in cell wall biosynthesis